MTTPSYRPLDDESERWAYGTPFPAQAGGPENYGPPPSKTLAAWSLALGWIPIIFSWVAAVIMAIVVLDRSKDGRDHGRKLAIGGLVGVAVWVAIFVGFFFARPLAAHRTADGDVSKAGSITIVGLRVGDCGEQVPTSPTNIMHVVPCTQPHLFQVLAVFQLSGDYPGDDAIVQRAEAGCAQRLKTLPALQGRTDLHLTLMRPEASSWTRLKTVVCMASTDDPSTDSLLSPNARSG